MEILKYLGEEWRDIEGYEGLYKVSSLGRVMRDGKILKPLARKGGYLQVQLCSNGIRKTYKIHRLVAKAFPEICGEWFEGCAVNHKDENPSNNAATNLEVCDWTYNNNYGHRKEKDAKSKSTPVSQYTLDGVFIRDWNSSMDIERELGIYHKSVSNCCKGIFSQTHGYIFKFKEGTSNTPIPSPIPFTSHSSLAYNKEENYEI